MERRNHKLSCALACCLLLGIAGRVLVPAGFMVAPGDGGWPIVPCPGVAPEASAAARWQGPHPAGHGDEHPEDQEGHPDGADPACFLGASFALAAEIYDLDLAPFRLPDTGLTARSSEPAAGDREAAPRRPRGPPSPLSSPA